MNEEWYYEKVNDPAVEPDALPDYAVQPAAHDRTGCNNPRQAYQPVLG